MTSSAIRPAAHQVPPLSGTTPLGTLRARLHEFFTASGFTAQRATEVQPQLAAVDHLRMADTGSWV